MSAEATHDATDEGAQCAGLVHHGEGATREEQHHDDDNDGQSAFTAEDFEWSDEPAPDGIIGSFNELEGGWVDGLASVCIDAGVLPGGDDQRQNPGDHHQNEQNNQRLNECPLTDLRTCFLFHGRLLDEYWHEMYHNLIQKMPTLTWAFFFEIESTFEFVEQTDELLRFGAFALGDLSVRLSQALTQRLEQRQPQIWSAADEREQCGLADEQNVHRFNGHNIRLMRRAIEQRSFGEIIFCAQSCQSHNGACAGLLLLNRDAPFDDEIQRLGGVAF